MFQKKIDRAMDWLKEKNTTNEIEEKYQEDYIELEKGDRLAIFISAILVFGPIFLILIGLLLLTFNY
ncbi:MAG: hypothetical protein GX023_06920 [Tissierellia bacterium]|nr:hypothetical protein [Tissierellia bacterium]